MKKLSYYQTNKNSQTTLYLDKNLYTELKAEAKLKFLRVNALIISVISEHLSLERLRRAEAEGSGNFAHRAETEKTLKKYNG